MRILTFVSYYLPGFKAGGPIQSVANLVEQLGDEFDFRIVTRDRDSGDTQPYPDICPNQWSKVGKAKVCYLESENQSLKGVAKLMQDSWHDVVYLNSFFHLRSSTFPLLAQKLGKAPLKPVIVAPRGEFSSGALKIKALKKNVFLKTVKLIQLHCNVLWHASTIHEADDIRRMFGEKQKIHIASVLPRSISSDSLYTPRKQEEPLRIIFLSRISPKKNLLFAIDVLSRLKIPIDFSIVGNIGDSEYWHKCQAAIAKLPANIRVHYQGFVPASEVPAVISKHDLFFLPTLGENFGHVIIEALGAGTPVLVSDTTPWQDFEQIGCGWVLSLNQSQVYVNEIEAYFKKEVNEVLRMREAAREYAHAFSRSSKIVEDNRILFEIAGKMLKEATI